MGQNFSKLNTALLENANFSSFLVNLIPLTLRDAVLGNNQFHGRAHRFDSSSLTNALDEVQSFRQSPGTHVSFWRALFTHLLKFVFHVSGGALTASHFDKLFSYDLPRLAVDGDKVCKNLFLVLGPATVVIAWIKLSAAEVMARLHRALLQALCNLGPGSKQLLRHFLF